MSSDSNNSRSPNGEQETAADPEVSQAISIHSVALSGILFLMTMYTLYFAASLIMPIVLAFLLSIVLSPAVRFMVRLRIPQTLSALLVMLGVAGVMVAGVYAFAEPAAEWMERAPAELRKLEYKLAWVKGPIKKIQETNEQVNEIAQVKEDSTQGGTAEQQQSSFSLVDSFVNRTTSVAYGTVIMLILLFFVLASGDAFLHKVVQVTPRLTDKKRVVETAREIQRHVSVYLSTITVINISVGVAAALAMFLLGVPNPVLWGAMVGILNFIPYLGPAFSILVIAFVSVLTFDSVLHMAIPPLAIFALNVVEGQFLTPILAGRRLALSPVAVFLSIVVLGWMWGAIGVLIAVPTLATIKLVCEHIDSLGTVATFLARH